MTPATADGGGSGDGDHSDDVGTDDQATVFQISEAELDAILEQARDRAEAVERGTPHHSPGDEQYAAGLRDGAEQLHRGVIERGDFATADSE